MITTARLLLTVTDRQKDRQTDTETDKRKNWPRREQQVHTSHTWQQAADSQFSVYNNHTTTISLVYLLLHTSLYTCFYIPASTHLLVHLCVHLLLHTCFYTPPSTHLLLHLLLHTCFYIPASTPASTYLLLHTSFYTPPCTPASTHLLVHLCVHLLLHTSLYTCFYTSLYTCVYTCFYTPPCTTCMCMRNHCCTEHMLIMVTAAAACKINQWNSEVSSRDKTAKLGNRKSFNQHNCYWLQAVRWHHAKNLVKQYVSN